MRYRDINFDGLVGPTHNYAGLSHGNVASVSHKGDCSSPRAAALQGLRKARSLSERGYPQAVLPPQERPSVKALRNWGIHGRTDADVIAAAALQQPMLLAAASSASAMWTANSCTMTPSCETGDERVHFTPANLLSKLHRSIEAEFTTRLLRSIFSDGERFAVHEPLRGGDALADEGAANHTRFCSPADPAGLHLFVYGRSVFNSSLPKPHLFPARQTLESFQAIARRHGIHPDQTVYLQQSPDAIDAGVFHNDVISVGNQDVFLYHESAFLDIDSSIGQLAGRFRELTGDELKLIPVRHDQVTLKDAVSSYLFNSQLLEKEDGSQLLVVPSECREIASVSGLLDCWLADPSNPVSEILAFDLRESMRNGGGPACLRNRVTLNSNEMRHLRGRVLLDDSLFAELEAWILKHYRDELAPEDLADPELLNEGRTALDELSQILHLPGLYDFQH